MNDRMTVEEVRQAFLSLGEEHPVSRGLRQVLAEAVEEATRATGNLSVAREGLTEYYAGMQEATVQMRDHLEGLMDPAADPEAGEEAERFSMRRPGGAR